MSADSTLTSVNFWDIEAPGGTAYQGEVDWILYTDAGGQPGASFASGAVVGGAVTRTFIQGGVLGFYDEYSLSFNVTPGVPLSAGTTYWLGLHNGPLTMATYSSYWETTNPNGTYDGHEDDAPFDGGWSDNGGDHAFNLGGSGGGVEDRSGGPNKKYAIYFVVSGDLASVGGATSTCGSISFFGPDPDVANQAEVDLVNVNCNESEITVTATNLVDTQGNTLASASVTFGLLIGDVNGDGVVDHADYRAVKDDLGQAADGSNFREDVATVGHNSSGFINAADLNLVKRQQGTSLP